MPGDTRPTGSAPSRSRLHPDHRVRLEVAGDLVGAGQRDDVGGLGQVRAVADPDDDRMAGDGAEPVVADDDDEAGASESFMSEDIAAIHAAPFPASGRSPARWLRSRRPRRGRCRRSISATVTAASRCTFSLADRDIQADIGSPARSAAALACR